MGATVAKVERLYTGEDLDKVGILRFSYLYVPRNAWDAMDQLRAYVRSSGGKFLFDERNKGFWTTKYYNVEIHGDYDILMVAAENMDRWAGA